MHVVNMRVHASITIPGCTDVLMCVCMCLCACACIWVLFLYVELDFCGLVCTTEMKLQISWEVKQIVKEATGIDAEYNGNCFLPDVSLLGNGMSFVIQIHFYTLLFLVSYYYSQFVN